MARLEAITGPMGSGKSEEVARRLRRATYAKRKISVVKPAQDDRKTRNIFVLIEENETLKNYERLTMQTLSRAKELKNLIDAFRPDILAIDEAQFLGQVPDKAQFYGQEFIDYLNKLLEKNKSKNFVIIAAGLDMDAWMRPFGIMPQLLAMADEVLKLTAICLGCQGEYGPAILTQKKGGTGEQVETGDVGKLYEARCRACHTIPKEGPA